MTNSTDFEDILKVLRRKNEEDVKKAESKFAAVSAALAAAHKRRESLEDTDAQYREYYGLPRRGAPAINPDLRAKFARLSTKEALQLIGRENDGMIVAKDVVKTLVRAAVYQSEKTASGNVYNTLARHTGVFQKVSRGRYKLRDAVPEVIAATHVVKVDDDGKVTYLTA